MYGQWRGLPARQNRITQKRYFWRDGVWQGLGLGYDTEFEPFAEELPADPWESKHQATPFERHY